jgi:hypothetical protein
MARKSRAENGNLLRGKPLLSRRRYLIRESVLVVLFLALLAGALYFAIHFEKWFFKGIGFAVLAVVAAIFVEVLGQGVFEIRRAFDYGRYREEWERANPSANRDGQMGSASAGH